MSTDRVPRVMSATRVRQNFSQVVNSVAHGEGRIIVEKSGTPAVVMVSLDEYRRLSNREEELAKRKEWLTTMGGFFEGIPPEELRQEIDHSLAEVKQDMHRERTIVSSPNPRGQTVPGINE